MVEEVKEESWRDENMGELHRVFPFPGAVDDVREYSEDEIRAALQRIDKRNVIGCLHAYRLSTVDDRNFVYFSDGDLASVLKIVADSDYVEAYEEQYSLRVRKSNVMGRSIVTVDWDDEYVSDMMYRYQDLIMSEYMYDVLKDEKFGFRMRWMSMNLSGGFSSWASVREYVDVGYSFWDTTKLYTLMRLYDVSVAKKQRRGL